MRTTIKISHSPLNTEHGRAGFPCSGMGSGEVLLRALQIPFRLHVAGVRRSQIGDQTDQVRVFLAEVSLPHV